METEIVLKSIAIMICGILMGVVGVGWVALGAIRKKEEMIIRLKRENAELNSKLTMTADQLYEHLLRRGE